MSKPEERECKHCSQYISCTKVNCDMRLVFNSNGSKMVSKKIADKIDQRWAKEKWYSNRVTFINNF